MSPIGDGHCHRWATDTIIGETGAKCARDEPASAQGEGAMPGNGLASVDHFVVLMLENRSFDHMLGYLYAGSGNSSPAGHPFEGLTGSESNPASSGPPVSVFKIEPATANAYYLPGADPGEGYMATNSQLFGTVKGPSAPADVPGCDGFVKDFAYTLSWQAREGWPIVPGTAAGDIMGCFTPEALPVLAGLARGYAVCDHWFSSVPTETLPNRAFACAGTSQGHMDDKTHTFTSPSIFGLLGSHDLTWGIYGYNAQPLTKSTFTDIAGAAGGAFGVFSDFTAAAAAGSLPAFTFLEPDFGSTGNSQHPNYNVALGEQLIHDVYEALRSGPGWQKTLLVITYDEHGGCYDHVPPPAGATVPGHDAGEYGFDFTRFGVRVPAVLVSPLIEAGTVFRVPAGSVPLDHTSLLKTVQQRWSLPSLTARDAAAPGFGDVLTLATPRTDDPIAGVTVPVAGPAPGPAAGQASHLQRVQAELISRRYAAGQGGEPPGAGAPVHATEMDFARYIRAHD
jgi:phospholipase C